MTSAALRDYDQRPADWAVRDATGAVVRLHLRFLYAPQHRTQPRRPWTSDDPVIAVVEEDIHDVVRRVAADPRDSRRQAVLEILAQSTRRDGSDINKLLRLSDRARDSADAKTRDTYLAIEYLARLRLDPEVLRKHLDAYIQDNRGMSRSTLKAAVRRRGKAAEAFISKTLDETSHTYDLTSVLEALADLGAQVLEALPRAVQRKR